MLDLLIGDGLIIDGTGNPGFYGAVGVEDERVTHPARRRLASVEARRVDRRHRPRRVPRASSTSTPTPGLVILAEPRHEPKVRQGVTTELIGIDGNSYAPFRSQEDFHRFVELNSGLDGNPPLPGRWSTVEPVPGDVHEPGGRQHRLPRGQLAAAHRRASAGTTAPPPPARSRTAGAAARGDGGGRLRHLHRARLPARAATPTPAELIELSEEAARLGGIYHTHVRYSLGDRFLDPFREALDIGRGSGMPVHITHFYQRDHQPRRGQPHARPRRGRARAKGSTSPSTATPTSAQQHAPPDPASRSGRTTAGPSS